MGNADPVQLPLFPELVPAPAGCPACAQSGVCMCVLHVPEVT